MKGEASMDIRLGIIGFGGMGKYHASIAPEGGVKVVAAADNSKKPVTMLKRVMR